MQLTGISYNGTLRHEYRYSATANDGKITSYKNWQSGEDAQYQYDTLGRLTSAATVGPDWGQSYWYDGWGNLLSKTVTKGTATAMSVTADPATNRISGLSYDANGNVTNLPAVGTIAYDGRNRQVGPTATPVRGYDPSNKKIWWKDAQANLYVDFYGPGGKLGTYQLFMPTNGSAVPLFNKVPEYTYFAGRLVKGEGPWTNGFVQQDRLGSAVTHLPYGDERTVTAQGRLKFATYWREDSGVDYADQRYYSSTYGRFLTSDPYRASGGPSDPGSWNRYAYTRGDPLNHVDPTGLADYCESAAGVQIAEIIYLSGNVFCPPRPAAVRGTEVERDLVNAAIRDAYDRVASTSECGKVVAGTSSDTDGQWDHALRQESVYRVIESTTYVVQDLDIDTVAGTVKNDLKTVLINRRGDFFRESVSPDGLVAVALFDGTAGAYRIYRMSSRLRRAVTILHELAHQMGALGDDDDIDVNHSFTRRIIENCFTRINGVWQ
jgi:RHS repeat-associated protein